MDPLLSEFGQPLPLSEEQLEHVRGETSTALYVSQTQLLQPNNNTHFRLQGKHREAALFFEITVPNITLRQEAVRVENATRC